MPNAHTPGPWYADKLQDRTAFNIFMPGYGSAGAQVFHCSNATACMGPQVEANALLIASAPDMLAALQAVASQLRLYGEVKSGRAIEDIVNDAINKATGA